MEVVLLGVVYQNGRTRGHTTGLLGAVYLAMKPGGTYEGFDKWLYKRSYYWGRSIRQ